MKLSQPSDPRSHHRKQIHDDRHTAKLMKADDTEPQGLNNFKYKLPARTQRRNWPNAPVSSMLNIACECVHAYICVCLYMCA